MKQCYRQEKILKDVYKFLDGSPFKSIYVPNLGRGKVDPWSICKDYTHFYYLNRHKWAKCLVNGSYNADTWTMNANTKEMSKTVYHIDGIDFCYNENHFCLLKKFSEEEIAVMDILE